MLTFGKLSTKSTGGAEDRIPAHVLGRRYARFRTLARCRWPDLSHRTAKSVTDPLRSGEYISPALRTVRLILRLPLWLKKFQATLLRWFSRPWGRNDAWASLIEVFDPRTALEERKLIVEREAYKAAWHEAWKREGLDFVLTAPHALPAVPRDPKASDKATLVSANYAFLYNTVRASASYLIVAVVGSRDARIQSGVVLAKTERYPCF